MSSFSTSLSGLNAEEQALSVISNDLANLNTTAFKSGAPVFSDLFYQMLGTDGAGVVAAKGARVRVSPWAIESGLQVYKSQWRILRRIRGCKGARCRAGSEAS